MSVLSQRQFRFASYLAVFLSVWVIAEALKGKSAVVPRKSSAKKEQKTVYIESVESGRAHEKKDTVDAGSIARKLNAKKIDINSADEDELMKLSGVGRTLAKRIVEYRRKHGKFNNVNQLINVEGIGRKKLMKIKKLAIVR
ncbi:hypothetical protein DRQ26_02020 [bacterium]|nr:MAG: hypothetical protein DRQ26_02020 [bacterium]